MLVTVTSQIQETGSLGVIKTATIFSAIKKRQSNWVVQLKDIHRNLHTTLEVNGNDTVTLMAMINLPLTSLGSGLVLNICREKFLVSLPMNRGVTSGGSPLIIRAVFYRKHNSCWTGINVLEALEASPVRKTVTWKGETGSAEILPLIA